MASGRRAPARGPLAAFDTTVPALMLKIGNYVRGHGAMGAIRSLGRAGVPVFAVTEDRWTPAAVSRYLRRRIVAPTTGLEGDDYLVEWIASIARSLGTPAVVIPTDDEAAVLVAEHAADLAPWLISPAVAPDLPRRLASKRGLRELCLEHATSTPGAAFPTSLADIEAFAAVATFPVVAKVADAGHRGELPELGASTPLRSAKELLTAAATWSNPGAVMLQEYIPEEVADDWIFHGYFDARSECLVGFTGVKYRSWPPYFGATSYARVVANPELAAESIEFLRRVGYCGIVDMDWRLDRRDGRYRLLDCNPRVGAQFRLFESTAGIDVVRAQHLDLTGREVPNAPQVEGRGFFVENRDLPALLTYRRLRPKPDAVPHEKGPIEPAWFAWDDPLPFVSMAVRLAAPLTRGVTRLATPSLRARARRAPR
ncbi:MAG TPA: ATP-grasp domain-containing protein [Acidimicrobiia bacterium]|jgi:D-aspartate ligase|nr:ATP-grasp domain-containing protein [Acidimicrobiia bacterium]